MPDMEAKFDPIRKGLLEFAVLTVISSKKVYAADILEILNTTEFQTQEGTLYPLLSRMRREGTVEYDWVESDAGPPRKYYRLTDKGKEQLESLRNYWQKLSKTLKQK
ncbi:MAG TPA: PadR family transcriptional regulator [Candidatus Paceibacterota bacterium]|jgi:PadR family transcriptional regulator PadR|nr:PadR family transcriptional regulator [Candidatus Paceibacterota bacterium]